MVGNPVTGAESCTDRQHVWPPTWEKGDTCNCGAFYLSTDGAMHWIDVASGQLQSTIGQRAEHCRAFLYIHGFLSESENTNAKKRIDRKRG